MDTLTSLFSLNILASSKMNVYIYPTETIYGIGGNGLSEIVIQKVQQIKGRDAQKPMLLLTDAWQRVSNLIAEITPLHQALMDLDLPITILFPPTDKVPSLLTASGFIGIRKTAHPDCVALIQEMNAPLLSTSANFAGEPSSHLFAELNPELLKLADKVIQNDQFSGGTPSSVVKINGNALEMIREGAVKLNDLQLMLRR
jgi:L-threonylcarbamoyladenylate synthase